MKRYCEGLNVIRVLQVGCSANPGGVENLVIRYFRHINREMIQFDFLDIYGQGLAFSDEIKALGGRIYSIPNYKRHPINAGKKISELIDKESFDIVHVHMQSAANLLPILIPLKRQLKVIAHSHSSATAKHWIKKVLNKVNRNVLRTLPVEKWGCGSKAGIWMWGEAFDKRNIIPNAIEFEQFEYNGNIRKEIRNLCGFDEDNVVIGYVGRFGKEKNVFFTLRLFEALRRKSNKYRLLTVGGNGLYEEFLNQIEEKRLDKVYYSAGIQEDTSKWYQAMDVFLLPSFFEGFPIVCVEAQASGVKCFVSENVSPEIKLTDNLNFYPINYGDETVWAEAIDKMIPYKRNKIEFPDEYKIEHAIKNLELKYLELSNQYDRSRIQ